MKIKELNERIAKFVLTAKQSVENENSLNKLDINLYEKQLNEIDIRNLIDIMKEEDITLEDAFLIAEAGILENLMKKAKLNP